MAAPLCNEGWQRLMKHVLRALILLIAVQCFGQDLVFVQDLKRPGDPVRILVNFKTPIVLKGGTAILQREGREGECHLPQVNPLKGEIVCTKIEKITNTEYLFSGVVENNSTGWYKLTKVVAQSGDKEKEYLWGHDFHDKVRILIKNPKEKLCVEGQD
jgi:hypothetical protein